MLKITGTMMLVLMLTTLTASADWLTPNDSDQSSSSETYLTAETTINGNGMYAPIPDTYHTSNMTYSSFSPGETGMMWLSELGDAAPSVYYGFNDLVTLDTLKIWNFNDESQLDASIEDAEVFYTAGAEPLASRTWISAGTITLARGTGSAYYVGNAPIDIATELPGLENMEITGLMLEVLTTYGSNQAGLSEIHFEGEVVPEPATMGLLAVGGLAMLRSRRRRNNK
jgi:hypothetical protein